MLSTFESMGMAIQKQIDALKKLDIPQHANIILFTLPIILKSVEIAFHNPIETFKLSCNFGTNLTLYVYFYSSGSYVYLDLLRRLTLHTEVFNSI